MNKIFGFILLVLSSPSVAFGTTICNKIVGEVSTMLNGTPATFTSNVKSAKVRVFSAEESFKLTGVSRPFKVTQLTIEPGKKLREDEIFADGRSNFTAAIDRTGLTEGHMYLGVSDDLNTYRYDGRLFRKAQKIKKDEWFVSDGLFIRYRKIPEEFKAHKEALLDFMANGRPIKKYTCVASAFQVMYKEADFEGDPTGRLPWFPVTALKHMHEHGVLVKGKDGNLYRLVPEIYTINTDPEKLWNRLPTFFRVARFIIPVLIRELSGKKSDEQFR